MFFTRNGLAVFMSKIILPYATLKYNEPIVHIVFHCEVELGFPEITQLTKESEKLSSYKPYVVLSDVRLNVSVTQQGKQNAANAEYHPLHRGTAVVVKSKLLETAANFFMNFRKPVYPYRAFTDKRKAIDWLLKLSLSPTSENNKIFSSHTFLH